MSFRTEQKCISLMAREEERTPNDENCQKNNLVKNVVDPVIQVGSYRGETTFNPKANLLDVIVAFDLNLVGSLNIDVIWAEAFKSAYLHSPLKSEYSLLLWVIL